MIQRNHAHEGRADACATGRIGARPGLGGELAGVGRRDRDVACGQVLGIIVGTTTHNPQIVADSRPRARVRKGQRQRARHREILAARARGSHRSQTSKPFIDRGDGAHRHLAGAANHGVIADAGGGVIEHEAEGCAHPNAGIVLAGGGSVPQRLNFCLARGGHEEAVGAQRTPVAHRADHIGHDHIADDHPTQRGGHGELAALLRRLAALVRSLVLVEGRLVLVHRLLGGVGLQGVLARGFVVGFVRGAARCGGGFGDITVRLGRRHLEGAGRGHIAREFRCGGGGAHGRAVDLAASGLVSCFRI